MSKWKPVLMKLLYIAMVRSSLPEVFCKKGDLRNFVKCTEKHLCQSLFFNKVADLNPAILFKKRDWHKCFTVNFTKFLRTPFLQNTSGLLLLKFVKTPILHSKPLVAASVIK